MQDSTHLPSSVFDWNSLNPTPSELGDLRSVANQATATFKNLEIRSTSLKAGFESHPPHQHPQEEFIVLKDGELDVIINGELKRVSPGSFVFIASNDFHHVRNSSEAPATYLVFKFDTDKTEKVPETPSAENPIPGNLPSTVFEWSEMNVVKTVPGERRDLFDSATATSVNFECHITTLNPGFQPHPVHRHPDEELVIVKEGLLQATINEIEQPPVGPGSVLFFASGDLHELRNVGDGQTTYHVLRIITEVSQ